MKRIHLRGGRELSPGEVSRSGLYIIQASKNGRILRASLSKDFAFAISECPSRYVAEGWIDKVK